MVDRRRGGGGGEKKRKKNNNTQQQHQLERFAMATFAEVEVDPSELIDGFSAEEVFSNPSCLGITFDDLIALPGAIDFGVQEVDLSAKITRRHKLNVPLASTPMDTVTEHDMAIGMALHGGIGFIHCRCTVEEQVAMVLKVKNYENGFILEPAVLSPSHTISDLDEVRDRRKISGVPITVDGKMGSKLVGLVSNRDTDFVEDRNILLSEYMTPVEELVTGVYPISIADANEILKVFDLDNLYLTSNSQVSSPATSFVFYFFLSSGQQKRVPPHRGQRRQLASLDDADRLEEEPRLPKLIQRRKWQTTGRCGHQSRSLR